MNNKRYPKHFNHIHVSLCISLCTKLFLLISLFAFGIVLSIPVKSFASTDINSPLTKDQQSLARKGNSYARSSKADKAQVSYQSAIDQAVSVDQCIALVKSTEHYGAILIPVRRNCLNKALHIAKTQDEYFQIISCARQSQLYEITKASIDSLIAKADSKDDLLTLAHKAQGMAMNDIAHVAMEKLYTQTDSLESKVAFAKQAKLMAMEDLTRTSIKDAMDQESNASVLCHLISAIEPLEQQDLQRKILRKAVYQVTSPEDCKEVFDMAKRLGQQDIVDLAAYKGRKMLFIRQAKIEQGEINEKEEESRRQAEAAAQNQPSPESKNPVPIGPGF